MKQPFTQLSLKAIHLICFAAYILISFASFAQYAIKANDVTFINGVKTGYTNTGEKDIVISDNINGVKVIGIGDRAFASKSLTGLSLANTITSIGYSAFYGNHLTCLTIPSSVLSIGSMSFYDNYLKSVSFEANSNIKKIWTSAFGSNSCLPAIRNS